MPPTARPQPHAPPPQRTAPLALVALAMLALGIAWTAQAAATVQHVEEVHPPQNAWHERGTFRYAVPVQDGTEGFENGTVLDMGEPGYFLPVSPQFHASFNWTREGDAAPSGASTGTLEVVAQDRYGDWSLRHEIADATEAASAGPLTLGGWVDLATLEARAHDEARRHGADPADAQWRLVATVRAQDDHDAPRIFEMPFRVDAPLYVLPSPDALEHVREHGEPVVTLRRVGGGLDALIDDPQGPLAILAGAAALAYACPPLLAGRTQPATSTDGEGE